MDRRRKVPSGTHLLTKEQYIGGWIRIKDLLFPNFKAHNSPNLIEIFFSENYRVLFHKKKKRRERGDWYISSLVS